MSGSRHRRGLDLGVVDRVRLLAALGEIRLLRLGERGVLRSLLLAEDRERVLGAEALRRAEDVTLVGAVLDLADGARPVLLERVVPLDDRLELEADARVADLLLAEEPDATLDVLALDPGLDLLDAHEVLVVERAEALDAQLQVFDLSLLLFRVHGLRAASPARCRSTPGRPTR